MTERNIDSSALKQAIEIFGPQRIRRKIEEVRKRTSKTQSGCRLVVHLKPTRKGADYIRVYVSQMASNKTQKGKGVFLHVMAYWEHTGKVPIESVSHLCGNGNCIEPTHLHEESHWLNLTRHCCKEFFGKHPDYKCPHSPLCLSHQ